MSAGGTAPVTDAATSHHGGAPLVSVVIVTYRSASYLAAALDALATALEDVRSELVVVDNASGDDVAAVVADFADRGRAPVRFVDRPVNDGFASGCHTGVALSTGTHVLLVNPDAVVDPGAVRALLEEIERRPRSGILGGRALDGSGRTTAGAWWGRPTLWSTLCFATGLSSLAPGHPLLDPEATDRWDGRAREVDVVSGAFLFISRATWDSVGGFDPVFRLYGEDADLCLRARDAGWRPRVVPTATFRHAVGSSTQGSATRTALVMRGRATVLRRHLRPGTRRLAVMLLVAGCGLRAAAGALPAGTARPTKGTPPGRPRTPAAHWRLAWSTRRTWAAGWVPGDHLEVTS